MIGLGVVLVLFKWWVVFIFFAGFLARYLILTLAEEKKLLKMFGNEYALYCRSTPRIFPAPGTLFKKKLSLYLPLKRKWFKSESVSFLAVLAGVTLLKCYSYAQR
jgi:hypothetical protein